jgi:hypothetical protein
VAPARPALLIAAAGGGGRAHGALARSTNPSLRRLARQILTAQRREILAIRRMLRQQGLSKSEYFRYDPLFPPG